MEQHKGGFYSIKDKIEILCSLLNHSELYTSNEDWLYTISVKVNDEKHIITAFRCVDDDVFFIDENNVEFDIDLLSNGELEGIDYMIKQRINEIEAAIREQQLENADSDSE